MEEYIWITTQVSEYSKQTKFFSDGNLKAKLQISYVQFRNTAL